MLRRAQVNHILRAAAAVTNHNRFVMIGTGAVIAAAAALMPLDWRSRAREYRGAGPEVVAICPDSHDIAVAKLCAWRDKDRDWLRAGISAGVLSAERIHELLNSEMAAAAPNRLELVNRLAGIGPEPHR